MSYHQSLSKNFSKESGSYFSAQGPSDAAGSFTDQGSSYDPRIRPPKADDRNSSTANTWSSLTRPVKNSSRDGEVNKEDGMEDESEEESGINNIDPNLALRVTTTNLVAVLRMNSDIMYLYELLQTYISFDDACRDSE